MKPLLITLLLATTATAGTHPFEGTATSSKGFSYTYRGTFIVDNTDGLMRNLHFEYLNAIDLWGNIVWGFDDTTFVNIPLLLSQERPLTDRNGVEQMASVAFHPARPLGVRLSVYAAVEGDFGDGEKTYYTSFSNTFASYPNADVDYDGDVDGTDFLRIQRGSSIRPYMPDWVASYGPILSSATVQAVPEPSGLWLLLLSWLPWRRQFVRSQRSRELEPVANWLMEEPPQK